MPTRKYERIAERLVRSKIRPMFRELVKVNEDLAKIYNGDGLDAEGRVNPRTAELINKTIDGDITQYQGNQLRLALAKGAAQARDKASRALNVGKIVFNETHGRVIKYLLARQFEFAELLKRNELKRVNALISYHLTHDPLSPSALIRRIVQSNLLIPKQAITLTQMTTKLLDQGILDLRRIKSTIDRAHFKKLLNRARVIVRTELINAFNFGDLEQTRQMTSPIGVLHNYISIKTWLTAEDENVCPICVPLNGKRKLVDQAFDNGKGGVLHPGAHPQCRCTLLYDYVLRQRFNESMLS